MKIVEAFPPQWDEIIKSFPSAKYSKVLLITIGDTCYNPYKVVMRQDLMVHEEVHSHQQLSSGDVDKWINKYIHDSTFRFNAELEAYSVQLQFIKKIYGQKKYKEALKFFSKALSSPLYGKICSEEYAYNKLKECVLLDNLSVDPEKPIDI